MIHGMILAYDKQISVNQDQTTITSELIMGQVHSDRYNCDAIGSDVAVVGRIEDVADSELNTNNALPGSRSNLARVPAGDRMSARATDELQQHVRKLSNVSHRNIQLLSLKHRSEKDAYADDLRTRRRSSLINLILGAPSSGPRFCDDLCSLSSHISELYFGIESFPEPYYGGSTSTLRLASIEDTERGDSKIRPSKSASGSVLPVSQKVRRLSIGSLTASATVSDNPIGPKNSSGDDSGRNDATMAPPVQESRLSKLKSRNPSLASTLASIDLTSSFEQPSKSQIPLPIRGNLHKHLQRPPLIKSRQLDKANPTAAAAELVRQQDMRARASRGRINQTARMIRRTGSELSLYSTISGGSSGSGGSSNPGSLRSNEQIQDGPCSYIHQETKLIILLQVALPFILAGFGNMAAGLVLGLVSQWRSFVNVPVLFVLLPPLIGLKGNIEMTLASRFSTLSNLNLLQTSQQRQRAYASNLTLVISQAIGLSLFAAAVSIIFELSISNSGGLQNATKFSLPIGSITLGVFASALITTVVLVFISSVIMSLAVALANLIRVNPDNLSTLIAALYGDVSCVYVYGLVAEMMFKLMEENSLMWPSIIVTSTTVLIWPITLIISYKFKETHSVALFSMPPLIISIIISLGSGALLSQFIGKFKLIALYQPVVNGFGANLVAVQASRVSTWLWCSALGKLPISSDDSEQAPKELPPSKVIGSLASFAAPKALAKEVDDKSQPSWWLWPLFIVTKLIRMFGKSVKLFLWSFCNSSPNAIAARLLLMMLIPAHTIYFFVIWLLSATSHVVITWPFYTVYIGLCLVQVFILLLICEPFMTLLMSRNMDPDVFGISILMAIADLAGTICLTLAFFLLASIGDVNALQ